MRLLDLHGLDVLKNGGLGFNEILDFLEITVGQNIEILDKLTVGFFSYFFLKIGFLGQSKKSSLEKFGFFGAHSGAKYRNFGQIESRVFLTLF